MPENTWTFLLINSFQERAAFSWEIFFCSRTNPVLYVQHELNSRWDWCRVEHNTRHKPMLLTTGVTSFFPPSPWLTVAICNVWLCWNAQISCHQCISHLAVGTVVVKRNINRKTWDFWMEGSLPLFVCLSKHNCPNQILETNRILEWFVLEGP